MKLNSQYAVNINTNVAASIPNKVDERRLFGKDKFTKHTK